MKRPESIIFAFMAAAAVSCTIDEPASDTGAISDGGFVIEAGIMGSKTVFTPPVSVEWASSDELSVLVAGGNYRFVKTANGDNSFSSVDFSPEEGVEYTYNVFYPYCDGFSAVDESGLAQGLVSLPYGGCDVQASTSDASHVKGFGRDSHGCRDGISFSIHVSPYFSDSGHCQQYRRKNYGCQQYSLVYRCRRCGTERELLGGFRQLPPCSRIGNKL